MEGVCQAKTSNNERNNHNNEDQWQCHVGMEAGAETQGGGGGLRGIVQGRIDGGISVFIPPKSAQVNFLCCKNDVRTAIQQFYTPPKNFYTPKTNFWLRPWDRPLQIIRRRGQSLAEVLVSPPFRKCHCKLSQKQEAQLLLGDRATRKHAKDC